MFAKDTSRPERLPERRKILGAIMNIPRSWNGFQLHNNTLILYGEKKVSVTQNKLFHVKFVD